MVEPEAKQSQNSNERGQAYSRSIIAKVTLPHNVGFLGKAHVAMVVHMHNELANLVHGKQKLDLFWEWLSEKIKTYEVKVLMGDFNMSLFRVIPELRSRGAVIDLGAWYPWKSLKGEPMSDSCGIFFVALPGVYTLNKNLGDIHDRDPTGVLKWADVVEGVIQNAVDNVEDVVAPPTPPTVQLRKRATNLTKVKTRHANATEALTA